MAKKWGRYILLVVLVLPVVLLSACGGDSQEETKNYKIGVVIYVPVLSPNFDGFKTGMTDLGYVEDENVTYIYNGVVDPTPEAIDAELANLIDQKVDMLFVAGNLATAQAQQAVAGTDIPVVFSAAIDPLGEGFVESISHPGGNLTGVQVGLEIPKALEMLITITQAKKVYVPFNPDDAVSQVAWPRSIEAASSLGIELVTGEVYSITEAVTAIENLPEDIDAIFRIPAPTLDAENGQLSQAAITRGLPMGSGLFLDDAVLMTLAVDFTQAGIDAANIADQIFDGIKPADLPVQTPEFTVIINLETADALGLDISDSILRQANKIITS